MGNEFIGSFRIQDYVDGWRLVSTLDNVDSHEKILQQFNLHEFINFDDETLKSVDSTIFLNLHLSSDRNEEEIEGTVACITKADTFLILMRFCVTNLSEIFFKCKDEDFIIPNKMKEYVIYKRSKNKFFDSLEDDKRMLQSHSSIYLQYFAEVRDVLTKKDNAYLVNAVVVSSIQLEKNGDY